MGVRARPVVLSVPSVRAISLPALVAAVVAAGGGDVAGGRCERSCTSFDPPHPGARPSGGVPVSRWFRATSATASIMAFDIASAMALSTTSARALAMVFNTALTKPPAAAGELPLPTVEVRGDRRVGVHFVTTTRASATRVGLGSSRACCCNKLGEREPEVVAVEGISRAVCSPEAWGARSPRSEAATSPRRTPRDPQPSTPASRSLAVVPTEVVDRKGGSPRCCVVSSHAAA